jgi:hypothetical protein
MLANIGRRLLGIAIVVFALAYFGMKWFDYDLPSIDVPAWVHSPAFWGTVSLVGIWCWLPVLQPVGAVSMSLAQETPRRFEQPQQIENEPFEMNGQWCIIWNGQYMTWSDEENQWVPYRG